MTICGLLIAAQLFFGLRGLLAQRKTGRTGSVLPIEQVEALGNE